MVLLNKATLSSFDFHSPNSLLLFQCVVSVILVQITAWLGFIKLEPWNWKIVQVWLPVDVIFVGMIATSFFALRDLGKLHECLSQVCNRSTPCLLDTASQASQCLHMQNSPPVFEDIQYKLTLLTQHYVPLQCSCQLNA